MKKNFRSLLLAAAVCSSAALGGALSTNFFHTSTAYAHEANEVAAARATLEASGDLSTIFKTVNKALEPSVVQIQTKTTVTADANSLPRTFQFGPNINPDQLPPGFPREFFQLPRQPQADSEQERISIGTGSGVIMQVNGSEGFILTNNHVVAGANTVTVTLHDGRELTATVVGTDPRTDLAVVKVKADGLIAANWGDSSKLEQGDWVMAFGSPFGLGGSMTHGIVSALNRNVGILGKLGYEDFIQTDAPINPGNSGGPLVNTHGEVIGLNQSIMSHSGSFSGLGFAIPSKLAQPIFESLKTNGKIVRGYLGVSIQDINNEQTREAAKLTGYTGETGVFIAETVKDGPAAGKLKDGDIITSIDGKDIKTSKELRETIAAAKPGAEVKMGLVRNGKPTTETVTVGEQPDEIAAATDNQSGRAFNRPKFSEQTLGLQLQNLNESLAKNYGLDAAETGALVTNVFPGTPAYRAGLRTGDLITSVNGEEVKSAAEAAKALKAAGSSKSIRLSVSNKDGSRFVMIRDK